MTQVTMNDRKASNAPKKIGTRAKDVPWYSESMGTGLSPAARELFEVYSKIPASEVETHIRAIRDKAWQVWPYPCIGQFRFLDISMSTSPHYPALLQRLKSKNEIFLDLGCCFGQELRKLAFDGAPQENLYGCDLRTDFFSLGYELFRDKASLKSTFIEADIFDSTSGLKILDSKVDIIYAGSFLHLFSYAQQVQVCERIIKLLGDKHDSVIIGRQAGNVNPGPLKDKDGRTGNNFWHNEESFRLLWKEVGEKTGTRWIVEVKLSGEGMSDIGKWSASSDMRRMRFAVFRE